MRKYTIVDYFGYDLTPRERMRAIKTAGFDGVILLWADYFDADYKQFPEYAEQAGLYVENAHAPYIDANSIWEDTQEGQEYTEKIIQCINDCKSYNIPTLVIHPINGKTPLSQNNIGVDRFKRILDAAERVNVNIAIENQGNPDYIGYVFQNIQSEKLYFCFDSGHQNYFSPETDCLSLYKDKLIALHLHDNNGKEDTHALPFTGNIDWRKIASDLVSVDYSGAIALEVQNNGFEEISDPVEFLTISLNRARKIL